MAVLRLDLGRGFAPDLAPDTPGVVADSDQMYPTASGYRPFRRVAIESTAGPLATGPCYGAFFQQDESDAGRQLFLASASKLYTFTPGAGTFVDVSGGASFNGPANPAAYRSPRWRWTMFGGDLIALNPADPPQKLVPPYTAAAALAGDPPHGSIVEAVGDFVFIFDSAGNDWNCCGIGNDSTWAPDIGTQAANGILGDTPGPITAARALGAAILVYKQRAVYLGTYLGPPVIWGFSLLAADAGAICNEAVVDYGGAQVFMGPENFYLCDGSPPRVLENPVRQWFYGSSLDVANAGLIWGVWDRCRGLAIWFYPSVNANPRGSLDRYLCWHPATNRWMTGSNLSPVQAAAMVPVTAGGAITYNPGAEMSLALMLSDANLYSLSGVPKAGYLTTGDIGDPARYSLLRGIRPRFASYPAANAARLTTYYRYNLGDTQFTGGDAPLSAYGWFGVRQSARYHAARIEVEADCELLGMDIDYVAQGLR